jgi:glyoxylase-like metal-dependent hydrolase (beta-lactamase superfamily II)/rhodanese-related sulfurtransferase
MFFRQILHEDLGCASYLVASRGRAAVIDPKWGIEDYLAAAQEAGARITDVLETHFHADHVSGRKRLASATGATLHVPADPGRPGSAGLRDGDVIIVGGLDLHVIGAPGHRPEHLAYLVTDRDAVGDPPRLLSGDSLLIGELARPDLVVEAGEGARSLWSTVRRLVALDDRVEVWPGHVGASLCGSGALTDRTSSTIGDELRANPLLSIEVEDEFVSVLTRAVPARPPRVVRVAGLNVDGAPEPGPLRELDAAGLAQFVAYGACVLDVRAPEEFDQAHIEGSINLPGDGQAIGTRAGWATVEEEPLVIVSDSREDGMRVAELLYAAGIGNLSGVSVADPAGWVVAGLGLRSTAPLVPEQVIELLSSQACQLIDVRDAREWREGHIDGALNLPLAALGDGSAVEIDDRLPLAVTCASGRRAAIAASVLRRRGHDAARVSGGVGDLAGEGARLVGASR